MQGPRPHVGKHCVHHLQLVTGELHVVVVVLGKQDLMELLLWQVMVAMAFNLL